MCALFAASWLAYSQPGGPTKLAGPYLGQKPPGTTPDIFAPGIVTTAADEYALEVSADGNEILFVRDASIMLAIRDAEGFWTPPAVAPFSGKFIDGEPCFSPDGRVIYFSSRRPHARTKLNSNIWIVAKTGAGWGTPVLFDKLPGDKTIHAPSAAANGNIYEDGIIRFKKADEAYRAAERLSPAVKGMFPFVAPDESYVLFSARPSGRSDADLFVSFQRSAGSWTQPLSLGDRINSQANEGNSFVTADGRFLFFSKKMDIYWVSAKVIDELRPKERQRN